MTKVALMPKDSQLPQLQEIVNIEFMKNVFQDQLPGFAENRLQIDRMKLIQFSYKPGKKCRVGYLLKVKDAVTKKEGQQLLFGELNPNANSHDIYQNAKQMPFVQPEFGPPIHFLSELDMVMWGFPNDAVLRQLPQIWDKNIFTRLLNRHWDRLGFSPDAKLSDVVIKVAKYVPRDRCTLRFELTFEGGEHTVIYGKLFNKRHPGAQIFTTIQTLWNSPASRTGAIIIPEPLFYEPGLNTIFMKGINGVNADTHVGNLDLNPACEKLGAALAGIHQCTIEGLPGRSDRSILAKLDNAEEILGNVDTNYRLRVAAINKALQEKYHDLTRVAPVPIHTSFRLSQLLLVDDEFALIDFDSYLMGNPVSDVASFVAHLLYLPLKNKITLEQGRSAITHFCRAYETHTPWGLPQDTLAWQTAAELVGKHAKKCVKLAKKNYHKTVDQLLTMAENILYGKMKLM